MALSIATFTTPLEQAAFSLAQQYSAKPSSRDNIPTDNFNNVLDVASIARILLDLPPQLSTVRILVQLIETRYRNLSAEMVGQWCSIRSQMEPAKGDDDAARKEKPPLVSDDGLLPALAADSSGSLALSSVPACPETTTTSVPSSPTSPTHDAMPSASTQQSPTTTSTPSTTMESAPVNLSMISPVIGPQDLPVTLPLHSSLANTGADCAGTTMEQNEDENLASVDASIPTAVLPPTLRDVDDQTISTSNANVSDPLIVTPPPSPDFEQEWPRSVPLSPTPRARIRSRFAQTILNSEDLQTPAGSPPRADSTLSDDWFFSESTIPSTHNVIRYSRVPPPDLQSVAYSLGELNSPTPASGSGSRGRSRRYRGDEEEVTRGAELERNEDVSGDTTTGRQNIAPSTSNRRKRRREDNRDREDGQPRARQSVEDNFARRMLRRLTPPFLRNLW